MHFRLKFAGLAAILFVALAGCGPSGPRTYSVSGSISFDGQPVGEGEIIFRSAEGPASSWASKISQGHYSLQSTPGAKRVEITASRKVTVKAAASGEGEVNYEMYIPEKYNEKSELKATVNAANGNDLNFDLKP